MKLHGLTRLVFDLAKRAPVVSLNSSAERNPSKSRRMAGRRRMTMTFPGNNAKKGFTIIEALFGVGVMVLLLLGVATLQDDIGRYFTTIADTLSAGRETRFFLSAFTAEARATSQSSIGSYPLDTTQSATFAFYADIDGDGLREKIRYFLDTTTLKKGVIKPSGDPLAYHADEETITGVVQYVVSSASDIFQYYDTNYDGTTSALSEPVDLTAVRLVKVTVQTDRDPNRAPAPITATTQVSLRNLKDNL